MSLAGSSNVNITRNSTMAEDAQNSADDAQNSANGAQSSANDAYNYGIGVNEKVIEAQKDIQVARDGAQTAVDGANKAVEEAGFSKTLADEAKKAAGQAASDANNAYNYGIGVNEKVIEAQKDIQVARDAAQTAVDGANKAGSDAKTALENFKNMAVGGRNLISGTATMEYNVPGVIVVDEKFKGNNVVMVPETVEDTVDPFNRATSIVADNGEYVVTFWAKADIADDTILNYFYMPNTTTNSESIQGVVNQRPDGATSVKLTTTWKRYWIKWQQSETTTIKNVIIGRVTKGQNKGKIYISSVMFTEGNIPKDWEPALEDIQIQITNINGELSQKISQTTFNVLNGIVNTQGTQINQNKNEIALKADTSIVNTIKGTVDKNTAAILVNTNGIKLKADQSTVNTLTGRVTTAEGQLIVQAGQISQTVSKTDLSTSLSGYATQSWTQGQIKTTAENIQLSVSKVQTNLDNVQVGGRNLIIGSGTFIDNPYLTKMKYQGNSVIYAKASGPYLDMYSPITTVIPTGKEYIVSFYAKADDNNTAMSSHWYNPNTTISAITSQGNTSNAADGGISLILSKNWTKYWIKWTQKEGEITNTPKHLILGRIYTGGVYLSSVMLSEGNKPLDWTAAPEDNASQESISSIELTINGIKTTVGDANSGLVSQVTQLKDQITSVVGSMSNPNLVANSGLMTNIDGWNVEGSGTLSLNSHPMYPRGNTFFLQTKTTVETSAFSPRFKLVNGKKYVLSFKGFASANVKATTVYILGRKNGEPQAYTSIVNVYSGITLSPSHVDYKSAVFTATNMDEAFVRFDNNGSSNNNYAGLYFTEVKVEPGGIATPWEQDASQSQITQLKSDINLRVTKDGLISQINLAAGEALIDADRILLSGKTITFGKDSTAFIPTAMITDLTADKITTGKFSSVRFDVTDKPGSGIFGTINGDKGSESSTSFYPRRWDGTWEIQRNRLRFEADEWLQGTATSTGKEVYLGYAQQYIGADYFKARLYDSKGGALKYRADISATSISMGMSFGLNDSTIHIGANGMINARQGFFGNKDNMVFGSTAHTINSVDGGDIWFENGIGSGGNMVGLQAKKFTTSSRLSAKTDISKLDEEEALNAILSSDIYKYHYLTDSNTDKYSASIIIDDVNAESQFKADEAFISTERNGRDDGVMVGYLMTAVKLLNKKIKILEEGK